MRHCALIGLILIGAAAQPLCRGISHIRLENDAGEDLTLQFVMLEEWPGLRHVRTEEQRAGLIHDAEDIEADIGFTVTSTGFIVDARTRQTLVLRHFGRFQFGHAVERVILRTQTGKSVTIDAMALMDSMECTAWFGADHCVALLSRLMR
jgi:hypothetical protein